MFPHFQDSQPTQEERIATMAVTTRESDRPEVGDHLALLLRRRSELLPAADDAHVLSELTTSERRISAARTGARAYDLAT